jgi:deoxycytidylate deaminase
MHIIQCGIVRVVAQNQYQRGAESEKMFQKADIELCCVSDVVLEYSK